MGFTKFKVLKSHMVNKQTNKQNPTTYSAYSVFGFMTSQELDYQLILVNNVMDE